ncbi:hypothetical protein [Streptomyces massasporeus]|uniref:hypothetical protein n=1 Tax=Streptomyces massasporeus TaxID=67324 RepID=UPI0033FB440E
MQLVTLTAASLPGLAALGALPFTWMQVGQASRELRISEHNRITSRFNSAINNLGSQSLDVRLGGIYALERIMQDSARDHPTVVWVLAAFAQRHARPSAESLKEPDDPEAMPTPEADVRAAIATPTGTFGPPLAQRAAGALPALRVHHRHAGTTGTALGAPAVRTIRAAALGAPAVRTIRAARSASS